MPNEDPAPNPNPTPPIPTADAAPVDPAKPVDPAAPAEPAKPEAPTEFVPLKAEDLKIEGEGITINEPVRDEFLGIMNNRELTPAAQAQALVDLQMKMIREGAEAQSKAWNDLQETWVEEVKADPEVGGDKLSPTLAGIDRLIDSYGSPELRQAFADTGAGNSLPMVKFLNNIAKVLNESRAIPGNPPSQTGSAAERMYPSMAKQP